MPGCKPSCLCGTCYICKCRARVHRSQLRKKLRLQGIELEDLRRYNGYRYKDGTFITDKMLEDRMTQYFIDKGWETEEWIRPNVTLDHLNMISTPAHGAQQQIKCP